jgi:nicotinate-nucleotide adenylyltransferase
MGADAVLGLTSWHRWQDLFDLAHIVVAHRPGLALQDWEDKLPSALAQTWKIRRADDSQALSQQAAGLVFPWATTALDISATAIRAQLATHQNPRYLLPDSVLDYIHTHHLYEN